MAYDDGSFRVTTKHAKTLVGIDSRPMQGPALWCRPFLLHQVHKVRGVGGHEVMRTNLSAPPSRPPCAFCGALECGFSLVYAYPAGVTIVFPILPRPAKHSALIIASLLLSPSPIRWTVRILVRWRVPDMNEYISYYHGPLEVHPIDDPCNMLMNMPLCWSLLCP
jgi:hypothetical protein